LKQLTRPIAKANFSKHFVDVIQELQLNIFVHEYIVFDILKKIYIVHKKDANTVTGTANTVTVKLFTPSYPTVTKHSRNIIL